MGTRKIKRRNKKVRGGNETPEEKAASEARENSDTSPPPPGGLGEKSETSQGKSTETARELGKEEGKELGEELGKEEGKEVGEELGKKEGEVVGEEQVEPREKEIEEQVEPTEEQIENKEKVELKASLDETLKEIPFVGEIIDKNPIAGHAITLFKSVFPNYSEQLTKFLSDEDNKAAINGIISEMSKPEFANDPTKQAEIFSSQFSSQFGEKLELSEEDLKKFTSDAIMSNVNTMKDKIKTRLNKSSSSSPSLENSDLPGASVKKTSTGLTQVVFNLSGGKRKSKTNKTKSKKIKSKKSRKSKTNKSKTAKKRTHKKKSKK
jgi:hypothetical protein